MRALAEALRFLTIIPVPGRPPKKQWCVIAAYPWAGLTIGVLTALGVWGMSWIAGSAVCAVVAIVLKILLSGGLHMDGLADLADGIGGGWNRGKRLEIMADSRLGSFGALALIIMFALQTVLMAEILGHTEHGLDWHLLRPLVLAPVLSRGIITLVIASFPTARPGGMGDSNRRSTKAQSLIVAGISALGLSFAIFGIGGIIIAGATTILMFTVAWRISRKLGGLTGDVYGALTEIGDLAVLFGAVLAVKFAIPASSLL